MFLGVANLEYGAVRRFPMRREAAWRGQPGLPHGTTWRRPPGLRECVDRVGVVCSMRFEDSQTWRFTPRTRFFRPPPNPLPQPRRFRAPGVVSREGGHVRAGAAD
jgi:hypothetical protein